MGKISLFYVLILIITIDCADAQNQINPLRNRLVFDYDAEIVADSISKMNQLMVKINRAGTNSYFITKDGLLYFSSEMISAVQGAINNSKVRNDRAFRFLNNHEINSFFYLLSFLLENHINGLYKDKVTGLFLYNYRSMAYQSKENLREVFLFNSAQDTLNYKVKASLVIIDEKSGLILVAPSSN
jgi:ligand-binding sensor domain-containing protein